MSVMGFVYKNSYKLCEEEVNWNQNSKPLEEEVKRNQNSKTLEEEGCDVEEI